MGSLIKENNIKKVVKKLDKENSISSVAGDVAKVLEEKAEEILNQAIERAKSNNRRTLFGRDL